MIPEIAIGAIGAALIGAIISFVSLIVSKESKVSEFRQAWIDSLRSELSTYLTSLNTVADARDLLFADDKERYQQMQPHYARLNESYYQIAFRLNSEEPLSKKLKECMVALSKPILNPTEPFDQVSYDQNRIDCITFSNALLKEEWIRVKRGEMVFRVTRWLTAIAAATFFGVAIFIVLR